MRKGTRLAAWAAVGTVGLGGAAAASGGLFTGPALASTTPAASSASPSASPSSGSSEGRPGPRARADRLGLGQPLHGRYVTRDSNGKIHTVDFQVGAVTAVSGSSLTVKSTDNFSATYTVNGDTRVTKDFDNVKITDIAKDSQVRVTAEVNGDTRTARFVMQFTGKVGMGGKGERGYGGRGGPWPGHGKGERPDRGGATGKPTPPSATPAPKGGSGATPSPGSFDPGPPPAVPDAPGAPGVPA
jgi:hypothetical protein